MGFEEITQQNQWIARALMMFQELIFITSPTISRTSYENHAASDSESVLNCEHETHPETGLKDTVYLVVVLRDSESDCSVVLPLSSYQNVSNSVPQPSPCELRGCL